MSSNRLRVLLASLLAVFAVSAVASASASATCFKVVTAGTGIKDSPCVTNAGAFKNEFIKVSTLETKLASREWCGKVEEAKTGTFKNAACTEAEAKGEFIKVVVPEWEFATECKKVAAGTGAYGESACETLGGTKEWEYNWTKLAGAEERKISSEGLTEFKLTAGGKVVTCKNVTDEGNVKAKGENEAARIEFTGCTANAGKCWADSPGHDDEPGEKDGVIIVEDLDTQLVERENVTTKKIVLANEFKENDEVGKKEFVTIEFDTMAGDEEGCTGFPTTKVTGQVAAIVENQASGEASGDVNLNFPSPELQGNTLKAFGVAATLTGTVKTDCDIECQAIRGK